MLCVPLLFKLILYLEKVQKIYHFIQRYEECRYCSLFWIYLTNADKIQLSYYLCQVTVSGCGFWVTINNSSIYGGGVRV